MKVQGIVLTGVLLAGLLHIDNAMAQGAREPYPLESWASREGVTDVQISPGGEYLGLIRIRSNKARAVVEIYKTADLDKKPYTIGVRKKEATNFYWVSDKVIVVALREQVRDISEDPDQNIYERQIAVADVEQEKLQRFDDTDATIDGLLPGEPDKIIVSFPAHDESGLATTLAKKFQPRSYWKFDLRSGTRAMLVRGNIGLANFQFDARGNPWLARGYDAEKGEFVWYWQKPGESGWTEIMRRSEDNVDSFDVENIDYTKENHLLVYANNGHDKIGLWSFNTTTRQFDELVHRREDADVFGVRYHSNKWKNPGLVTGVGYFTDRLRVDYFDPVEKAAYEQFQKVIPYAHNLSSNSRSRDGATITVFNSGPLDPGTFYLLHDSRLQAVGSKRPLLENWSLADVQYSTYQARDGVPIPAYLTVPRREPPYPLIVLPHDGPFIQEPVDFDVWAQMLANNGFMVLQPQYRGSLGYGTRFHMDAFKNGGPSGIAMHSDLDDGAKDLVRRGLVDPDRIAMFGWSYGGYAALTAASREDQIYQCVIAAAAVLDPSNHINDYRYRIRGTTRDEQLDLWRSNSLPLRDADKVTVPLLLVRGSADEWVTPDDALQYHKLLDWHDKGYTFLELEDAGHHPSTLDHRHQEDLYEAIIEFLQDDCGPDGL